MASGRRSTRARDAAWAAACVALFVLLVWPRQRPGEDTDPAADATDDAPALPMFTLPAAMPPRSSLAFLTAATTAAIDSKHSHSFRSISKVSRDKPGSTLLSVSLGGKIDSSSPPGS